MSGYEMNCTLIDMWGINEAFKYLLASWVSNNPTMMLVGDPGCGKTEMMLRAGALLREHKGVSTFTAHAATFDPDDHRGIPVPSMQNGVTRLADRLSKILSHFSSSAGGLSGLVKAIREASPETKESEMVRIKTDSEFLTCALLFIDEINRATPRGMNTLLQAFSSGHIDGQKLAANFKVSAINDPKTSSGAEELPDALAERMAIVYRMVEPSAMTKENRLRIISRQPINSDFWLKRERSRKEWNPPDIKKRAEFFVKKLTEMKQVYYEIREDYSAQISTYVDRIMSILKQEVKREHQARRRQFIFDNIIAIFAVNRVLGESDLISSAKQALQVSLVSWLYGVPIKESNIAAAHEVAERCLVNPEDVHCLEILEIQRRDPIEAAVEAMMRPISRPKKSQFLSQAFSDESVPLARKQMLGVLLCGAMKSQGIALGANDLREISLHVQPLIGETFEYLPVVTAQHMRST